MSTLEMPKYLSSLISYANLRVDVPDSANPNGKRALQVEDLEATYSQAFGRLDEAVAIALQPVHQVRVAIEVLRAFMGSQSASVDLAGYRQAAYMSLLRTWGTPYEELRLIRAGNAGGTTSADLIDLQKALASRLGIDPSKPDQLQQLLLQPNTFTEEALEELFGLVSSERNPFASDASPQPKVLMWQLAWLRELWGIQDEELQSDPDFAIPIVEPDLVSQDDLQEATAGNPIFDLWQTRLKWVNDKHLEIKEAREAVSTPIEGFNQIVSTFVGAIDLVIVAEQRAQGTDISSQLAESQLDLDAFLRLVQIRMLATTGTVLDEEWIEVYSILVQRQKRLQFADWREEEKEQRLILGPDHFKEADDSSPPLPAWRASFRIRRNWEKVLDARIKQQKTVVLAHQAGIDAAEEATLPLLRDALIAHIAAQSPTPVTLDEAADRLTKRLLLDFRTSGNQKITRIAQALETLQGVLFSLRSGRLEDSVELPNSAANWRLTSNNNFTEQQFDLEWRWLGAFETWQAVFSVLVNPEQYLLPSLREEHTQAFKDFIGALRTFPVLTPQRARGLANDEGSGLDFTGYKSELLKTLNDPLATEIMDPSFRITEELTVEAIATQREKVKQLFQQVEDRGGLNDPPELGTFKNPNKAPNWLKEVYYFVPMALALQLQQSGQFLAALDWYQTVYAYNLSAPERKIYDGLRREETLESKIAFDASDWLLGGLNPHAFAIRRRNAYTRFTLISLARCLNEFADTEYTRETNESIARARGLYFTVLDLLGPEMQPAVLDELLPSGDRRSTTPTGLPNPIIAALHLHAELSLNKLRQGRNIAGMERTRDTRSDEDTARLRATSYQPTQYRYSVLIQRAKELVNIAQQVEEAFLSALEKRDSEAYSLLNARHDLRLAQATVELQNLRVNQADFDIGLARLQKERSEVQADTYQQWINDGFNRFEKGMIQNYKDANRAQNWVAGLDAALTVAQSITTASGSGYFGSGLGAQWSGVAVVGGLAAAKAGFVMAAQDATTSAQINSFKASHERRKEEWLLQKGIAEKDVQIGEKQIRSAQAQKAIVGQERIIAGMQASQGAQTVEFLANKFTNVELYDFMSGVMEGVFRYFLQQATAVARLAQAQLAFERQETLTSFILTDYWQSAAETALLFGGNISAPATGGNQSDRRGLTGSARLLRDIYQLDQLAFDTRRRKLQMAQAFSLARLFPFEFQRFRETGTLLFSTPMELLDREFPGHYLRTIKRVSISVVALIPPVQGLRATLSASGVSRVMVGPEVFEAVEVRRSPESIAFTSPVNATGLLDLEPEGELLLPFEGSGVDTTWRLELPKPANPFDFATIADAIVTVEYTALNSYDYRQQVIKRLNRAVGGERPFSLRNDFPDVWYELNNPRRGSDGGAGSPQDFVLTFQTGPKDFPPNIMVDEIKIEQLLLYFSFAEMDPDSNASPVPAVQISRVSLNGLPSEQTDTSALSADGLISTRRPNGTNWTNVNGKPFGKWELSLPGSELQHFADGKIEDVLFVIVWSARTPPWPL